MDRSGVEGSHPSAPVHRRFVRVDSNAATAARTVGKKRLGADPRGKAGLGEDLALSSLQTCETESDAALSSSCVQLSQRVDRRGVEERPGLGVQHEPADVWAASASASTRVRRYSALTKKGGASKR